MIVPIKLRQKYIVGKVTGGSYKPRTNQGGTQKSIGKELFADWVKREPGKTIHRADKERQAALPKRVKVFRGQSRGTGWKWVSEQKGGQ